MATLASTAAPKYAPPVTPPARYVLGSEIARGGMGRVVEATDTVLGRVVAFKEALTRDGDTLKRFERETRITARLEHPSIVPVYDAGGSPGGMAFYVMRKVSGQPLERLVAGAETLHQRLALIPHIVAAAQAIAHAHERHIVHRDIKPSNILVGDLGETVVIDWGLAKVIGEPDEHTTRPLVDLSDALKTRVGIVYGTPGFMAPEQLRGAPVTEGCDVYALGATLYHLLSRVPPHHAKTADEMMKAAVAAAPVPIRDLVDGVPRDLSTIVDKALAHDPEVRYQNARALAEDLNRFLAGQLVASHHYSPRDKLVRLVRKNRGIAAAIVAAVAASTFALVRVVNERNRADAAARIADVQRAEAVHHAEQLVLAHARDAVDVNPTKAIAMLKPLAARYWREVRAIGAAARATGVAWGVPASKQTLSLEMSRDGRRALSAGVDGVIRVHDLVNRQSRVLAELKTPIRARFADDELQIVAWRGQTLMILDPATGRSREVNATAPIASLEIIGATAYWIDAERALWHLSLAVMPGTGGAAPAEIALDEPARLMAPSPDGRWIALASAEHLYLYDLEQPAARPMQILFGDTHHISWAADSRHVAVLVDRQVIDIATLPEPTIVHRDTVGLRQYVAHSGGYMYTTGGTDLVVMRRTDGEIEPAGRKQLRGDTVGLALSRNGALVAGATGGLTIISDDGDRVLPLQAAHVEAVYASPSSPYVVAQLENRLLVWDLDDIQPRRLAARPPDRALFATSDLVIAGGTAELPAQAIAVASGAAVPLGTWPGLTSVAAAGDTVAIVDGAHHVHLVAHGGAPEDLPGEVDIAGFATSDKLVLATLGGSVYVHDLASGQRSQLVVGRSRLIGLAWGRGRHPWVAAAFVDGTLWRKNLVTGTEATCARVPWQGPARIAPRDGKLLVDGNGAVMFLHDDELHTWRTDGTLGRVAKLPKVLDDLGEAGSESTLAFASDATIYAITPSGSSSDPPASMDASMIAPGTPSIIPSAGYHVAEVMPAIEAGSAAMSPDTGLVIALEHGALEVIDPLVRQRWTLGWPERVAFEHPAISANGHRVLAQSKNGLLVWSIEVPASPEATVAWLDAMTNAIDDPSPGGLGWR